MSLARGFAVLVALVSTGPAAEAGARPVVVELFTSQGCSSCPPADALLTRLASRADLLPLAFHVTYWNALGWQDPYSFAGATERQSSYAARLGGGSYTPEIVVDGRRGMVGSDARAVEASIAAARGGESVPVRVSREGDVLAISLGVGASSGRVLLVGFDPHRETAVRRGENGGRTLTESNIVRSFRVVGQYTGRPVQLTEHAGAGQEAAVLVQAPDGRIIGAARN